MIALGVDVGQARDPAALAAVDGWDVRHLERLPLGTSYPKAAERVAAVATAAAAEVVVDATGVGRALVDMIEALGLSPVAVTLTGGARVRVAGRRVSLPRSALFRPLAGAVESGRLRVAPGLPGGAGLLAELLAARGGDGGGAIEARGPGHHGDLMTAVALALWWRAIGRL